MELLWNWTSLYFTKLLKSFRILNKINILINEKSAGQFCPKALADFSNLLLVRHLNKLFFVRVYIGLSVAIDVLKSEKYSWLWEQLNCIWVKYHEAWIKHSFSGYLWVISKHMTQVKITSCQTDSLWLYFKISLVSVKTTTKQKRTAAHQFLISNLE